MRVISVLRKHVPGDWRYNWHRQRWIHDSGAEVFRGIAYDETVDRFRVRYALVPGCRRLHLPDLPGDAEAG
jgi:hypothetical protein